jgi:hypothetical protein
MWETTNSNPLGTIKLSTQSETNREQSKVVHSFSVPANLPVHSLGFDSWTSLKIYNAWITYWVLVEMLLKSQLFLESYHDLVKCIHTCINEWKQGVCDTVALPFTLKSILRQKKKNYGNSNISPRKNIIFKKKSSNRNQNPSRYHNSIISNLKFQHKPKISSFKNPHIKIDLLLLPRGPKSIKLLYSIMNLNTNNTYLDIP